MAALALLAGAFGAAQASPRLHLQTDGLAAAEMAATNALFRAAAARLTPAMREQLAHDIPVRWSTALDETVHGRARRDGVLLLNRRLLPGLLAQGQARAGAEAAALSALLHELAHFLERADPAGPMSRDPRLLDLAGWQVRATPGLTRLMGRTRENRFRERSPDRYELDDPREYVAVNLEHYLLDADYACRRPALYRYFERRWGAPAGAGAGCPGDFAYVDAGDVGVDADAAMATGGRLGMLDPERIYQVDYLLAEGNDAMMSRWGHSMLRLVICAPGRPRGPDCRLDLEHHRVLSFRAFVGDVQISSWRGLTGRYPSRLFVLPLDQVIDEYTKVELRGLQSLPLRLERDEIAALVERAAQLHWSYDGRYFFLGNNCAVETYKLLRDGVPRIGSMDLGGITPNGLSHRLQRAGLADGGVLADPARALREGYRFDSMRERFQTLFEVARRQAGLPQRRVEDWLEASPQQRRPWLDRSDLKSAAALLVLEQAARRQQQLRVRDAFKRRYLQQGGQPGELRDAAGTLRTLLEETAWMSRPADLLADAGYGLPQVDERAALEAGSERRREQLRKLEQRLEHQVRALLDPAQARDLDAADANIAWLGTHLRELHRQAGGLRLD
nr:DUF4105 domain-containing protein [Pseudoxanthomonas sp.]